MADKVNGKGSITDTSQLFIYPKGETLTADDLDGFIKYHNGTLKDNYKKQETIILVIILFLIKKLKSWISQIID